MSYYDPESYEDPVEVSKVVFEDCPEVEDHSLFDCFIFTVFGLEGQ